MGFRHVVNNEIFRLSARAKSDFRDISVYTLQTWDLAQSIKYGDELEDHCQRLADNRMLGRNSDYISLGLRRSEVNKHVIFYRFEQDGIVVSRILHQRMQPQRQVWNNDE